MVRPGGVVEEQVSEAFFVICVQAREGHIFMKY